MSESVPIFQLGLFVDKYPVTVGEYHAYNPQYQNPWAIADNNPKKEMKERQEQRQNLCHWV
jgi:hypothetical protein